MPRRNGSSSSLESITQSTSQRVTSKPNNVNSLEHFASSYSRAQSFLTIERPQELSRARSFFIDGDSPNTSANYWPLDSAIDDDESVADESALRFSETSSLLEEPVGFKYAPVARRMSSYTSAPHKGVLILQETEAVSSAVDPDRVIVRKVETEDGRVITEVAGQSTAQQTIFNSVNVLIGIGLLSLPLGFKYSGWLIGASTMIVSAISTFYTAKLLAKCLDRDSTIVTYADVAYTAYGHKGRLMVSVLFVLELVGAGVSLVVLFADSLYTLYPHFSRFQYKVLAFLILTPPSFLPLRILSISSVFGIISTMSIVVIFVFCGFYKTNSPGSLIQPMETWLFPQNWKAVPLSIGIFMAPWGGHAVFPNIYRDMRHPHKYGKCLTVIYQITFLVDFSMCVIGFLMFGDGVKDEVTKNLLLATGYPGGLNYLITVLIALIPLAKAPLNSRPIVTTLDALLGVENMPPSRLKDFYTGLVRVFVIFLFVSVAIVFPDFDRIIALVGSLLCISVCLILPLLFYIKIYDGEISQIELFTDYILVVVFSILAVLGTVWSILPPDYLGIQGRNEKMGW
jgi:solute carrier family 32 (vesicular inhibitory amino acid transporter)